AIAQVHGQMDAVSAAAAEKDRRPLRREPRAVRGEKQIGLERIAMRGADAAQIRRAGFLAHLDDELGIEAELAAARIAHAAQGGQENAVLALVIGNAAA